MPCLLTRILVVVVLVGIGSTNGHAAEPLPAPSVQAENLLRESIAGVEGKEIIVSRVSFPPRTELPWHWHPGEEFFYVIYISRIVVKKPDIIIVIKNIIIIK